MDYARFHFLIMLMRLSKSPPTVPESSAQPLTVIVSLVSSFVLTGEQWKSKIWKQYKRIKMRFPFFSILLEWIFLAFATVVSTLFSSSFKPHQNILQFLCMKSLEINRHVPFFRPYLRRGKKTAVRTAHIHLFIPYCDTFFLWLWTAHELVREDNPKGYKKIHLQCNLQLTWTLHQRWREVVVKSVVTFGIHAIKAVLAAFMWSNGEISIAMNYSS